MEKNQANERNENKYGISMKDIWAMLYTRLENDNKLFWGRLPFFISILGLCVTGYGIVLLKLLGPNTNHFYWVYHCLLIFITFIGYIVSLFWVIISKASRYWYERYNETIHALERPRENELTLDKDKKGNIKISLANSTEDNPLTEKEKDDYRKIFENNHNTIPYNLFYLANIPERKTSKSIFSQSCGSYSIGKYSNRYGAILYGTMGMLILSSYLGSFSPKNKRMDPVNNR